MSKAGVKCRRCGHVNAFGKVFCGKCGRRLDLSQVNTRALAKSTQTTSDSTWRLVRFLIFLVLLAMVTLTLWPVIPQGRMGTAKDAKQLEQKLRGLARAEKSGLHVFEIVSEEEINAYLSAVLEQNEEAAQARGMRMGINEINVQLLPTEFTVVMLANWGPLRLSYEVTGVPDIAGLRFGVDVRSIRWGHLPLFGPPADWMENRLASVFLQMKQERKVLDRLGRCDLGQGRARVVTTGKAGRNQEEP